MICTDAVFAASIHLATLVLTSISLPPSDRMRLLVSDLPCCWHIGLRIQLCHCSARRLTGHQTLVVFSIGACTDQRASRGLGSPLADCNHDVHRNRSTVVRAIQQPLLPVLPPSHCGSCAAISCLWARQHCRSRLQLEGRPYADGFPHWWLCQNMAADTDAMAAV